VQGIPGLQLHKDMADIRVAAGDVLELPVRLSADEGELKMRSTEVVFTLVASDNPELAAQEYARFLGPR
jgi:hypothetical protein